MLDLFGQAILDYQTGNAPEDITTETNISEPDPMPVDYLFRNYAEMPKIEQKALQLCRGKVLDIGCGAASHSLYLQQKGFEVTAIDISQKAIEACRLRGLKNARVQDMLEVEGEKYDSILLLMNGTGIFRELSQVSIYLKKLQALLHTGGQVLIDSSDIIYMFDQLEDGSYVVPADHYYGELTFTIQYKNQSEAPFKWLYLDYNTLQNAAHAHGFVCELVAEGDHFDYLARLSQLS